MNFKHLLLGVSVSVFISACGERPVYPDMVIYTADTVVTMDKKNKTVKAVAVENGEIIDIGSEVYLKNLFPGASIDDSFKNKTILPGLIDPHMHVLLGGLFYGQAFAPPWPMAMPDSMTEGYDTPEKFHTRLEEIVAQTPQDKNVVMAYGFHNLVQGDLDRTILDRISPERPLIVWHYSGHERSVSRY